MRGRMMVVIAAVVFALGCGTSGTVGMAAEAPAADAGKMVLEVESFKLTKATVKELKDASGGKVVVFTDEAGEAESTVATLKKGKYEVVVYGFAPSDREDAFYVRVGGQAEERRFMTESGKIAPADKVEFTQAEDGPCKILLTFGEENVMFDRVEITPVK